jgi:hypothetical protein
MFFDARVEVGTVTKNRQTNRAKVHAASYDGGAGSVRLLQTARVRPMHADTEVFWACTAPESQAPRR